MKNLMKRNSWLLTVLLSLIPAGAQAGAYEVSALLGTANQEMPFVRDVVKSRIALIPGNSIPDFTTGVAYFAWKNGTQSLQTIQVIQENGSATLADVKTAIDIASSSSTIVLAPLAGTESEEMCAKMAEKPDTVFLITLGEIGYTLSPFFTKCASRNILFVTVLNAELTDLGEYASSGPLVRLAVPGMNLTAPVDRDRRVSFLSDGFGMAIAAGKLSAFLRKNPTLKGAGLLAAFLAESDYLPALKGKITGAKAILHFEQ